MTQPWDVFGLSGGEFDEIGFEFTEPEWERVKRSLEPNITSNADEVTVKNEICKKLGLPMVTLRRELEAAAACYKQAVAFSERYPPRTKLQVLEALRQTHAACEIFLAGLSDPAVAVYGLGTAERDDGEYRTLLQAHEQVLARLAASIARLEAPAGPYPGYVAPKDAEPQHGEPGFWSWQQVHRELAGDARTLERRFQAQVLGIYVRAFDRKPGSQAMGPAAKFLQAVVCAVVGKELTPDQLNYALRSLTPVLPEAYDAVIYGRP